MMPGQVERPSVLWISWTRRYEFMRKHVLLKVGGRLASGLSPPVCLSIGLWLKSTHQVLSGERMENWGFLTAAGREDQWTRASRAHHDLSLSAHLLVSFSSSGCGSPIPVRSEHSVFRDWTLMRSDAIRNLQESHEKLPHNEIVSRFPGSSFVFRSCVGSAIRGGWERSSVGRAVAACRR